MSVLDLVSSFLVFFQDEWLLKIASFCFNLTRLCKAGKISILIVLERTILVEWGAQRIMNRKIITICQQAAYSPSLRNQSKRSG